MITPHGSIFFGSVRQFFARLVHRKTYGVAVFEMVSAFGGIGLTLGIPTENFSFSGAFKPLSKIIVCIIMLRGRHRGLPVAIDRASTSHCFEERNGLTLLQFYSRAN